MLFGSAAHLGWKQFNAGLIPGRAATVFLATTAINPLVETIEKPEKCERSNGDGRTNNKMCIHALLILDI